MKKIFDYQGKRGYKQTKVGVISKEWEVVNLGNYVQLKHGWAFNEEYFTDKGDYILVIP